MFNFRGIILVSVLAASTSYATCRTHDYYCSGFEAWRALSANLAANLTSSINTIEDLPTCKTALADAARQLNYGQANIASAGHVTAGVVGASLVALLLVTAL